MKKIKTLFLSALILCLPLSFALVQTGCTTTQQTITYNTLHATAVTVDNAYSAFWDMVVAGKVTKSGQQKVQDARAKYQLAFEKAVIAAKMDYNALTPVDVQALAVDLITTITKLTD